MSFTSSLFHSRADCERTQRELFIDIEPEREQQFVRFLQHELPQIGRHARRRPVRKQLRIRQLPERNARRKQIQLRRKTVDRAQKEWVITCEENLDRYLSLVDSPSNALCLCTGSLGCAKFNDVPALVRKYSAAGRIGFMHLRNVKILEDGSFEERAHLSSCGSLDMYAIVKALVETGFDGYVRPDHGRMIWGETGKPGYGLYDRALGAAYINGLFEACEKAQKGQ